MNKLIIGKGGISAEVIADSINIFGDRITTLKLHYHRFIHAEFLRHRMFSHSVSSSRAIPVEKVINQVKDFPAVPIYWGKNKPGMSADEEVDDIKESRLGWESSAFFMANIAEKMINQNLHKQVTNRILEPYQFINQVVTATDFDNFFYLRLHKDAQPEIQELARVMHEAMAYSEPKELRNDFHMPFIDSEMLDEFGVHKCIKISASVCAQTSYRTANFSSEVAEKIYKKLAFSKPVHASPFEHIAFPFTEEEMMIRRKAYNLLDGHGIEANQTLYSRNFKGWTQYRTLIEDDTYNG